MLSPELGCGYVATRVHYAARRRSGYVAAGGARTQAGTANGSSGAAALAFMAKGSN